MHRCCLWVRGQIGNNTAPAHFPMNPHMRLGVSPTTATSVVHSQLWVSVSHSASPVHSVCRLTEGSPCPPILPVCLVWLTVSLIPWLSEFHAVWFSGTAGCLLILDWLLSSFGCARKWRVSTYNSILAGTPQSYFSKGMEIQRRVQISCHFCSIPHC